MRDAPPRVFISYAQESDEHSAWVLALAHKLAAWGIEPVIDRFCDWPERGWRVWMSERIDAADWVLVICTAEYLQRFEEQRRRPIPVAACAGNPSTSPSSSMTTSSATSVSCQCCPRRG